MVTFHNCSIVGILPKMSGPFLILTQIFSRFLMDHQTLNLQYIFEKCLDTLIMIPISDTDARKIIQNLDLNKAHGHDKISIRMIKICDKPFVNLRNLSLINALMLVLFCLIGKKTNVNPVHQKCNNYCLKNY